MREFIRVMKALADPTRVKIIKMLETKAMCVCELRATLGLAQPTVSKHLKALEEAGLVDRSKEGQWVNYRIREQGSTYAAVMLEHLADWLDEDEEIRRLRARLPSIDRETICRG